MKIKKKKRNPYKDDTIYNYPESKIQGMYGNGGNIPDYLKPKINSKDTIYNSIHYPQIDGWEKYRVPFMEDSDIRRDFLANDAKLYDEKTDYVWQQMPFWRGRGKELRGEDYEIKENGGSILKSKRKVARDAKFSKPVIDNQQDLYNAADKLDWQNWQDANKEYQKYGSPDDYYQKFPTEEDYNLFQSKWRGADLGIKRRLINEDEIMMPDGGGMKPSYNFPNMGNYPLDQRYYPDSALYNQYFQDIKNNPTIYPNWEEHFSHVPISNFNEDVKNQTILNAMKDANDKLKNNDNSEYSQRISRTGRVFNYKKYNLK